MTSATNIAASAPAAHPARTRTATLAVSLAAAGCLTVALGFAGYQQIFSTFAEYDDEGYVMLSLASFLEGNPLYDQTYTQYGPAFFVLQAGWHKLTGLPITHDITRFKTLGVWLCAAWLCAGIVYKETRNLPLSLAALLLGFFHLERLCLEPGHPQEFCVLGVLGGVFLCAHYQNASTRQAACVTLMLGVLTAVLLMTKLNIGLFLFTSIALLHLLRGGTDRWTLAALACLAIAALALPFALTLSHLKQLTGFALPISVTASLLATMGVGRALTVEQRDLGLRHALGFGAAAGIGCLLFAAAALISGTSLAGLWHGLIGQHLGFKDSFFTPAPIYGAAVLWAVLMLDLALTTSQHAARVVGLVRIAALAVLTYAGLEYLTQTFAPLQHGLQDRGAAGALVGWAAPLLWIVLLPGQGFDQSKPTGPPSAGRLGLCLVAALQPLAAYPTPGTQMAVGSVVIALGLIVALHDALQLEHHWLPRASLIAQGFAMLLVCTLLVRCSHFYKHRQGLTPLALPGAQHLRVPAETAETHRWLAETLRERTATFVFGEHARNSLYFWTGLRPPTPLNPTFWPFLLGPAQQQRIIEALEQQPRAGVVHAPFAADLPKDSPLLEYLQSEFRPAETRGSFEIWLRKS